MQGIGAALVLKTVAVLALCAGPAAAHDIPDEVHLHAFVKPEGGRLHLVARIPLALLLNVDLPKRGPGYLDLAHLGEALPRAIAATAKGIELYEDGARLEPARGHARIALPSDRSFERYETARAAVYGPKLPDATEVFWNQGYFDAHLEYPIRSERADFALHLRISPGLGDRLKLAVRFITPEGTTRAYQLTGGADRVYLDPRWYTAFRAFVESGFLHILEGVDHLLFLLCLVIPFRHLTWTLLWVVTSFTVAHSITLIAGAYGLAPSGAWFPPFVEVLIALSILYMAIENVAWPNLRRRWLVAGLFGLVHGFAFAFLFREQLQFAGSHLLLSLAAFNVGIELGQLAVLAVAIPLFNAVFRGGQMSERLGTIILSLIAGHTAWHWLGDRVEVLRRSGWPLEDSLSAVAAGRWALLGLALGAVTWLLARMLRGRRGRRPAVGGLVARGERDSPRA